MHRVAVVGPERPTVVHGKFAAYLKWSQPFLHRLVTDLEPHARGVVLCNRVENADRFPAPRVTCIRTRWLVDPALALVAAAHLKTRWNPDLLHAHFGWSGLRLLLLRQYLRVPLVTTFGGRDLAVQMHEPGLDSLYEVLCEASDHLVCVSEDLRDRLLSKGIDPERVSVIRRGVDLGRFRRVTRRGRDPRQPLRLLMVGRLVEKKGHRFVLEALSRLVSQGRRTELVLVGGGEEEDRLRQQVAALKLAGDVQFRGVLDEAGVRAEMAHADLFLQCSVRARNGDTEGLPNSLVEAAATGLPVVATRHGGICEAVLPGVTGLLVDEADVDGLASALAQLADDPPTRLRMGLEGRRHVARHFSHSRQVADYAALYRRLRSDFPPRSEAMRRFFIPRDFRTMAAKALFPIDSQARPSVSEMIDWLVVPADPGASGREAAMRLWNRLLAGWRLLPANLREPLRGPLAGAAHTLLRGYAAWQGTGSRPARAESADELAERALEYFRRGGDLPEEIVSFEGRRWSQLAPLVNNWVAGPHVAPENAQ